MAVASSLDTTGDLATGQVALINMNKGRRPRRADVVQLAGSGYVFVTFDEIHCAIDDYVGDVYYVKWIGVSEMW